MTGCSGASRVWLKADEAAGYPKCIGGKAEENVARSWQVSVMAERVAPLRHL